MRFKVPQDVQRADRIVGPLTWKQLIILGVGGGICYGIYVSLAQKYFIEIWLPPLVIVGGITVALAFLKIHGLTFEHWILAFIEYHVLPKKRFWKKGQAEPFISSLQKKPKEDKKLKNAQDKKKDKKKGKSIKELSKVLDSYGGLEKRKKKEALKKLINHK
jgi:hypothetical protein